MLDANAASAGHDYYEVGALEVSLDGEWLAFCEDTVGRRQYVLRFKNLTSGEVLPVAITDVEADVAWANDNRDVLYIEKDPETLLGPAGQEALARGGSARGRAGVRAGRPELLHRAFEIQVGPLPVHSHGRHALDGMALCGGATRRCPSSCSCRSSAATNTTSSTWTIDSSSAPIGRRANFRLMRCRSGARDNRAEWRDLMPHREDAYLEDFEVFTRHIAPRCVTAACARSPSRHWRTGAPAPWAARRLRPRSSPATSRPTPWRSASIRSSIPTCCATPIPR